jgi:hypothetical protein
LTIRQSRRQSHALGYFDRNAHRMRYDCFKPLGIFTGSGAVQAACKSIVGQPLKLSGMRQVKSPGVVFRG